MALKGSKKKKNTTAQSAWAPRIFMIQASNDRGSDYNAMMNCAFAAVKHQVMVDACYLRLGKESSPFLEQVCDLTGGLFLAPNDRTQGQGAFAQILLSVFLAPLHCRHKMKLPGLNQVDFRARCFESGAMVDRAFVCNQCLSVFSKKPTEQCPTCGAWIVDKTSTRSRVGPVTK
jgi:transcription initiation factor TFIIH subunit 3